MTNKTYNQYCAVAHALDSVGERWTLLIIRNLLITPQRFSDLRTGLPGISTNILTDRLKILEEHGIIGTRYLPPPAASMVYELTQRGHGLTETLAALARWGSETLGAPKKNQAVVMESVCFMLQGFFWRDEYLDTNLNCTVQVKDDKYNQTFGIHLSSKGVQITEPSSDADVELQLGLEHLNLLSSRQKQLRELVKTVAVKVIGTKKKVDHLYSWVEGR
jgi:DNA-binding HxlR family transcriptional regulator